MRVLKRWGCNWSIAHHQGDCSHNPLQCILRYALHVLLAALTYWFQYSCASVLQVKIWFQNRRTKWKKIDNISNAEAAEHKNHTISKDGTKSLDDIKLRTYSKHASQSSNSSIESDSKSSVASAVTEPTLQAKSFKDILQSNHTIALSPDSHFQTQMDSAKDVLLNLSFNIKDKS